MTENIAVSCVLTAQLASVTLLTQNSPLTNVLNIMVNPACMKVWWHRVLACDGSHSYSPGSRACPSHVTSSQCPRCSSRPERLGPWLWLQIHHCAFFSMIPTHRCWTTDQMMNLYWTFFLFIWISSADSQLLPPGQRWRDVGNKNCYHSTGATERLSILSPRLNAYHRNSMIDNDLFTLLSFFYWRSLD